MNKKILMVLCAIFFVVPIAFMSTGCNNNKTDTYSITYVINGGTNNKKNPTTFNENSNTILLLDPSRKGYSFDGWFFDEEFTNKVTTIASSIQTDVTLYAKWSAKDYKITYILNGGTNNNLNPITYNVESETITLLEPTKEGYVFDGWYSNSTFSGEQVTNINNGSIGTKRFYAKWSVVDYGITYILNGGTNNNLNPITYNIESETITLLEPTKEGYAFDGWYTNSNFTGNKIILIEEGCIGNKTLYAKFNEIFLYNNSGEITGLTSYGKTLSEINIPSQIDGAAIIKINQSAFLGHTSLTSIMIPNSVTSIGNSAFYRCGLLESVVFEENSKCQSIGDYAFYECSSLMSILLPSCIQSIDGRVFSGCGSLTSITIPSCVTSIEPYALSDCSSLINVIFEENSKCAKIGYNAFSGCESLTSINIPSSVTSIGDCAFEACRDLTSIIIPSSVTSIGFYSFACCGIENITLPFIGDTKLNPTNTNFGYIFGAYSWSDNNKFVPTMLKSVTILEGCESIEDYAFRSCSSLESITIPESCESIGESAFAYCGKLTSIIIPNSVESIGDYAFRGCSSLASVTIPSDITSIESNTFMECYNLESLRVDENNKIYDSRNDCNAIIETATNTLIFGCKNTIIPNNITSIGDSAFEDCRDLTTIIIPSSVTSIGNRAFNECRSLSNVIFEENSTCESIGESAFAYCRSLTCIMIPNSVIIIKLQAFYECESLESAIFEVVYPWYKVYSTSNQKELVVSKYLEDASNAAKFLVEYDLVYWKRA